MMHRPFAPVMHHYFFVSIIATLAHPAAAAAAALCAAGKISPLKHEGKHICCAAACNGTCGYSGLHGVLCRRANLISGVCCPAQIMNKGMECAQEQDVGCVMTKSPEGRTSYAGATGIKRNATKRNKMMTAGNRSAGVLTSLSSLREQSNYRLGDAVRYHTGKRFNGMKQLMNKFPGSIGAEYVEKVAELHLGSRFAMYDPIKIRLLSEVCKRHCSKSTLAWQVVVHLRLGDGISDPERKPEPPSKVVEALQDVFPKAAHTKNIALIAYALHSNQRPGPARIQVRKSREYIGNLTALLRTTFIPGQVVIEEGFTWEDADRQLCDMIKAEVFIRGGGGFSDLAEEVRRKRGMNTSLVLHSEAPKSFRAMESLRRRAKQDAKHPTAAAQ
jgi:hypothetical protein